MNHHHAYATVPHTLAELDGLVAVLVSNPPYIPPDQVPVDVEVREHDPEIALYGRGADGLEVPRAVLNRAQQLLRPGGVVRSEEHTSELQSRGHLVCCLLLSKKNRKCRR